MALTQSKTAQTSTAALCITPMKTKLMAHKTASPRTLPTPRSSQRRVICDVCQKKEVLVNSIPSTSTTLNFDFDKLDDFVVNVNTQMFNLQRAIESIGAKICTIEESIMNHRSTLSNIERSISEIADRPDNATPKNLLSSVPPTIINSNNKTSSRHLKFTSFPSIETRPSPVSKHNTVNNAPSRNHRSYNTPSTRFSSSFSQKKSSILIMGDSNTKYIKLPQNFDRIPTYTD